MFMWILGWLLVMGGLAGALFLIYEAATIPFLRGAGLAQADFELFVFSIVIGVPAIVVSVLGLVLLRRESLTNNAGKRRHAITPVIVTGITVIAVASAFGFSLLMRTYGFFWK